jgi:hypothetical protein
VLPLDAVVGLEVRDETVEDSRVIEGLGMGIVGHHKRGAAVEASLDPKPEAHSRHAIHRQF